MGEADLLSALNQWAVGHPPGHIKLLGGPERIH